jgi:hypothetical protein
VSVASCTSAHPRRRDSWIAQPSVAVRGHDEDVRRIPVHQLERRPVRGEVVVRVRLAGTAERIVGQEGDQPRQIAGGRAPQLDRPPAHRQGGQAVHRAASPVTAGRRGR